MINFPSCIFQDGSKIWVHTTTFSVRWRSDILLVIATLKIWAMGELSTKIYFYVAVRAFKICAGSKQNATKKLSSAVYSLNLFTLVGRQAHAPPFPKTRYERRGFALCMHARWTRNHAKYLQDPFSRAQISTKLGMFQPYVCMYVCIDNQE